MCGIAGVIAWANPYRTSRETLAKMSASIAHRGPDGEGLYLNHEADVTPDRPQAAFAFRRLAILDPDPRAMQPFHLYGNDGNPRLTLTFNGEIYNFRELRAELTTLRPDYTWRTTGDTEVLLLAYDTWRENCLEKFNGMFAFAVWDEQKKELFLARDRMGQKPLFYTLGNESIAFASEIAALRPAAAWAECAELDEESVFAYLNLGYIHADRTIHVGVRDLLPSTYIFRGPRRSFQHGYFHRLDPAAPDDRAPADSTRHLLETAVTRQLVSDVPLGVFLSGGIDSSVVAACARRAGPVTTFSIAFDDPRYDESPYARRVAEHLRTTHHEFRVTPHVAEDLPRLAAVFGQPFADSSALPTHYLSRETRRHVKVALSGDGGDELFGGYDRYRALALTARLTRTAGAARPALARAGRLLPAGHPKSRLTRLRRLLRSVDRPPAEQYASYVELFDFDTINALRGTDWTREQWAHDFDTLADEFNSFASTYALDSVRAARAIDLLGYLPGDLLTKVDRASMLHNLEVRSPFMDHELVRFASTLTTDQLLKGGPKRMLREAFAKDLPDFVFKRKKMGFAVPIGDWFRTSLRPMLHDHLFAADSFANAHFNMNVVRKLVEDHETGRADHSQRLYALLMLELWHALQ